MVPYSKAGKPAEKTAAVQLESESNPVPVEGASKPTGSKNSTSVTVTVSGKSVNNSKKKIRNRKKKSSPSDSDACCVPLIGPPASKKKGSTKSRTKRKRTSNLSPGSDSSGGGSAVAISIGTGSEASSDRELREGRNFNFKGLYEELFFREKIQDLSDLDQEILGWKIFKTPPSPSSENEPEFFRLWLRKGPGKQLSLLLTDADGIGDGGVIAGPHVLVDSAGNVVSESALEISLN